MDKILNRCAVPLAGGRKSGKTLALTLALLCLSPLSHAADPGSYTYTPEGCGFTASFPSEPHFTRRCPSDPTLPCLEVARFTSRGEEAHQTFEVEMSCQGISEEVYQSYTKDNLESLVVKMTEKHHLGEVPPVDFDAQEDGLKIASSSGLKRAGFSDKIFLSQIWVNPHSVMTIEGEMDLETDEKTEEQFITIMRSVAQTTTSQSVER
ncbi:MAG: hypothetical protein H6855_07915 [Rhodospirillales bacterium]|nr:hypothetical protein [Rhodospirillales bacterium]MCB9973493.1 hypothetical protein [Rhodospirillales bacterium]MCB9980195.1 hypothetical protein [Rhodospirillales bacterium]